MRWLAGTVLAAGLFMFAFMFFSELVSRVFGDDPMATYAVVVTLAFGVMFFLYCKERDRKR